MNIGPPEILVILLIALVVVGPAKLPELGRSIGRGLREFRKVQDEVRDTIKFSIDTEPDTPAPRSRTPRTVEPDRAAEVAAEDPPPPSPAVEAEDEDEGAGKDDPPPPAAEGDGNDEPSPPAVDAPPADVPVAPPVDAVSPPPTNGSTPPPAEE
jgi:TatA/E family protein of Tat protein translocase